ncbi:MAG: tetratricopeptide repeat protein, partial [Alicyclobacillus sp.]|nr:tetratricopeptide repeat protein [Alicyclobacillus sp.]
MTRAKTFARKQFVPAASELVNELMTYSANPEVERELGGLFDELGKAQIRLGEDRQALQSFRMAVEHTATEEARLQYDAHLAIAYQRVGQHDAALRLLTRLLDTRQAALTPRSLASIYANLAVVQGVSGFHEASLDNTRKAIAYYHSANHHENDAVLYNNLGVAYLNLGQHDAAKEALLTALELTQQSDLSVLSELCRLHIQTRDVRESMRYVRMALPLV